MTDELAYLLKTTPEDVIEALKRWVDDSPESETAYRAARLATLAALQLAQAHGPQDVLDAIADSYTYARRAHDLAAAHARSETPS